MARGATKKQTKTFEQKLWEVADKLRGNQEPNEYKHIVLGLVFVKYVSDRFEAQRAEVAAELEADGIAPHRREASCWKSGANTRSTTCFGCRLCELDNPYATSGTLASGANEPKQVFFSFDATKAYGTGAEEAVAENQIVHLDKNAEVLYGFTWNTEPDENPR